MTTIYIIKSDIYYKVGISDIPEKRIQQMQTGNPMKLEMIAMKEMEDKFQSARLEKEIHVVYQDFHKNGEWFWLPESKLNELIETYGFILNNEEV